MDTPNTNNSYARRVRAFIEKQAAVKELTPQSTLLDYLNAGKSLDDWLNDYMLIDQ